MLKLKIYIVFEVSIYNYSKVQPDTLIKGYRLN